MIKKIITPIALLALILTSGAYAATIDSVVVSDFDNSVLTVSGTVEPDEKGVSVAVLKKGERLSPGMLYSNDTALHNGIIDNLKYEASFKFDAEEGFYDVYVSGCDKAYEFEYISKDNVLLFVNRLGNNEIAENKIFSELDRYSESIGVNISFADNDSKKNYLAKNIIEYTSEIKNNGVDGVRSVVSLTEAEFEFMAKLKNTMTASNVNSLINEYSESARIELNAYNSLSDSMKTKACLNFVGSEYSNMKAFRADFQNAVKAADKGTQAGGGTSGTGGGSGGGNSNASSIVTGANGTVSMGQSVQTTPPGQNLLESFDDLNDTRWAWEAILFVVENNIMNGFDDGKFRPQETVTREQFAKIITLAFDLYNENLVPDFDDVSSDSWAAAYIASAKESGIMMGIDDRNFGCGEPISRQDICVVIYRAARNKGIVFENNKTDFNDFEYIKDYAKEAVGAMAGSGIISGMGDGNFEPEQYATRAQAAKLIAAVMEKEAE